MGWFGYGKYDGDETSSVQISIVETVAKKFNFEIKDKKGNLVDLDNFYLSDVAKGFVNEETARNVAKHLNYILKELIEKPKKNRGGHEYDFNWKESSAIGYMMVADFYMNHKLDMPKEFHAKVLSAMDYLNDEHAKDFDSVSSRRRVLNKFVKDLGDYPYVFDKNENPAQMDLFEDNSTVRKLKM